MSEFNYTECGLDNVFIQGVDLVTDDKGERVYFVPNINGLHKCIAHHIITHEYAMSSNELRFLRTEMGLTQAELAKIVKRDAQTVGRWERSECPFDETAEVIIRIAAAEKLDIDVGLTVGAIAESFTSTVAFKKIKIDGSNPKRWKSAA